MCRGGRLVQKMGAGTSDNCFAVNEIPLTQKARKIWRNRHYIYAVGQVVRVIEYLLKEP